MMEERLEQIVEFCRVRWDDDMPEHSVAHELLDEIWRLREKIAWIEENLENIQQETARLLRGIEALK